MVEIIQQSSSHVFVPSGYMLDEVQGVLLRPRLRIRYKLGLAEIDRFVGELADAAEIGESTVAYPVVLSDLSDDRVFCTAVNGGADVLCTGNTTDLGNPNVAQFWADPGGERVHRRGFGPSIAGPFGWLPHSPTGKSQMR